MQQVVHANEMKANACTMHPTRKSSHRSKQLEVNGNAIYRDVQSNLGNRQISEHWQYNRVTD